MDSSAGEKPDKKISLISLTTDFGLSDEYVGVMKGVILRHAPRLTIVDLCHHVAPGNVLQAAFLLVENFRYFPPDTLHVAVVDPGVGTARKILLARACGHFFLAPDNGLLSFVLSQDSTASIRQVSNHALFLSPLSATFHGRDIFAPVAGALGAGFSAAETGPLISTNEIQFLSRPRPTMAPDGATLTGLILRADHFGNLLTNIHQHDLLALQADLSKLSFCIGGTRIDGLSESYAQQPAGSLIGLIGSHGYLEISQAGGNAHRYLAVNPGQMVTVSKGD